MTGTTRHIIATYPTDFGPARRQFLLGSGLLAVAAASLALKPHRVFAKLSASALDKAIPKQIGPYRFAGTAGLILPSQDELSAKLYDVVLTRMYQCSRSASIGLCIAYGSAQDSGLQLHRPDECYPAQGFAIGERRELQLDLAGHPVPAAALTATRSDRTEQLLYWTRIGDLFATDARAERLKIYHENLRGRLPDGVLVRLSIASADSVPALARLEAFAKLLYGRLPPVARQILLGT